MPILATIKALVWTDMMLSPVGQGTNMLRREFIAFLGSTAGDIPQNVAGDLIAWLSAPQRGVTRARNEAHDSSALVLNGAEVNRVLDYAQNGLRRVINAVVPRAMRTCSLVRPTMRWYMVPTRNRCNRASHRLCRQSKN